METKLRNWVEYIGSQTIPVFNDTVQSVLTVARDDKSSSKQLADIIRQDAAFTTRVLQVANSSFYNRSNTELTSLNRIILLLGYQRITEICLTLSILDTIVDQNTRKQVYDIASKSFHAAIQARALADKFGLADPDSIYISTLLYNIGEIAFWSLTGKSGQLVSDLLKQSELEKEEAERDVLGTTFRELSLGLVSQWSLPKLLVHSLQNPDSANRDTKLLGYANQVSELIIRHQFEFDEISGQIAAEFGGDAAEIKKLIKDNLHVAGQVYLYYL